MTNEEFVRAHWLDDFNPFRGQEWLDFLAEHPESIKRLGGSDEQAASVMAEYTRERLEQIRQLEEHWVLIGAQAIDWERSMEREEPWTNRRAFWARGYIQFLMISARLESALADLKRGMREQA